MPGIRVTKPFKLSLLHRTYQYRGEQKLAVSVLGMFSLTEPGRVLPENELWSKASGAIGRDGMLDAAMPKSRGEFLVNGNFHAPGGKAAAAGYANVRIGKLQKRINVYGDRHWIRAAGVNVSVSEPEPMTSMPLDFAHAFGGKEHKQNPLGRGIDSAEAEGEVRVMLPNLELPGALIGSPSDRPAPACYGMFDPMWPQRYAKVGTYDQKWLKERAPGLADDLEWSYFNVAAEDQQAAGYWRGDEELELSNLHPALASIQARLPGLVARAFIVHGHGEDGRLEELPTRLDTVHLFPDQEVGICIWRGDTRIGSDDASDIAQILIGYERMADAPRSLEHYQEALRRRLDRTTRAMLLLDERDLIPDGDKSGMAEIIERSSDQEGKQGLLAKHQRERMKLESDKTRSRLAELGVDAALLPDLQTEAPAPSREAPDIAKLVADARKHVEQSRALAREKMAATCKQLGIDPNTLMNEKSGARLPRFSAAERIATVQAALALAPVSGEMLKKLTGVSDLKEMETKLQAAEEAFRMGYVLAAHSIADALPDERRAGLAALRAEVLQRVKRGESLARMDLAGIDLSGAALRGVDLSGAYLEFANLSGADLSGAKFSGAIAARANFSGAKLAKADFSSANLGKCSFLDAQGEGADFSGAVVSEASFENGVFPGARFVGGQMQNTDFTGADFSGADFQKPLFMDCRLDGAKLNRARLHRAMVIGGSARGLDLSDSKGEALLFVNVDLDGLKAARAEINKLRLVGDGTRAQGADFGGAKLPGSNLRGIDMQGSNFERAVLDGADLSEAKLKQARFRGASAQRAHFMKTDLEGAKLSNCNLKEAMLNKARLVQADLAGSNCFGAEFLGITVGETRFHGANLKRTKLKDWQP